MIIKKYVGKTEEEATTLAKKELGGNVVIMNVRPVRHTGFLAFLRAPKMEVTAALEEDNRPPQVLTPQNQGAVKPAEKTARVAETVRPENKTQPEKPLTGIDLVAGLQSNTQESSMADLARMAKAGELPPLKVGAQSAAADAQGITGRAAQTATPDALEKPDSAAQKDAPSTKEIEKKLDTLHNLLEQRIVGGQGNAPQRETEKETEPEASAKEEKEKPAEEEPEETGGEILSYIRLLYNTLLENEVDERYANELTDEAGKSSGPNMTLDQSLANVYQKMVLKFGKPETITPAREGAKAEIFIGPTGVGKTTTIAKLASRLHVQDKKKVALLTVDTYRIAAAEQLRTYATIMETPFRVIYSVEEMKQALEDFKDYDYIMIDTAGHSLHNEEQKETVASFIEAVTAETESETFLVLSATTKYRDLVEIAEAYARMVDYKLIFTKMDETSRAGNLYNMRLRTGAPMSYITNGQDVPDDIDVFNAQKIVKHLLGGK